MSPWTGRKAAKETARLYVPALYDNGAELKRVGAALGSVEHIIDAAGIALWLAAKHRKK